MLNNGSWSVQQCCKWCSSIMNVTLTAALHCLTMVINLFSSFFPSQALWRQGASLCASSANKTCATVNVSEHANDTQASTPTHASQHAGLAKKSISMWGRLCGRRRERSARVIGVQTKTEWQHMKGRQTYKREEERQRQENYDGESGENEWAQCVTSARLQSLTTSEKFALLMACTGKTVNMSHDHPGSCFHRQRANAHSSAVK